MVETRSEAESPVTTDERVTIPRSVRALALICLAMAAPAIGQLSLTAPPAPWFRVSHTPERSIRVNEIVDLGTVEVRKATTYEFSVVAGGGRGSGRGAAPLHVGLSADSPAIQIEPGEVEVLPGERVPFEVRANSYWLGTGTHAFEIEAVNLDDPGLRHAFRIQVTVLDAATIQDAIRALYERYRQYTVGSGQSLMIELSEFETFRRQELADFGALDLIANPGGQTLAHQVNYLGSSEEGERIVISPSWRDAGDYSQASWMQSASGLTFLESIELDSLLDRHTRATRYQVDVAMDGQSRAYSALVLWGGGGYLQFLDHVLPGVSSVAGFEIQPGFSPTLLADTIAEVAGGVSAPLPTAGASRWTPESVASQAGVRRCEPFFTQPLQNSFFQTSREGHDFGDHRLRAIAARTCECLPDCTSRCEVEWTLAAECSDHGQPLDGKYHRTESLVKFDTRASSSQATPANCPVAVHCGVRECPNSNCAGFSVGIDLAGSAPQGGGGSFGFDFSHQPESIELIDDWHLAWDNDPCPPCIELFDVTVQVVADPSNGAPFDGGRSVTVQFQVGDGANQEQEEETFDAPTPLYSFGRFKQGLSYGISATGCLDCEFSGPLATDTIQGPLNFTLTCSRPSNPNECPDYPVAVNAGAECLFCPPGVDPEMPSLTATLSAPPTPTQTMPIDEGTQPFPNPLPDGTEFEVTFTNPPARWTCPATNASGRIVGGPAEVELSCIYSGSPPTDNCALYPPACVAPPDCGYVWVHWGNLTVTTVYWVGVPVPGGEEHHRIEVQRTHPVFVRTLHCPGSAAGSTLVGDSGVTGRRSAGSTSTSMAPLVLLRNSSEHEFTSPSVPIEGVARDDASTVTGVEVFVDGQQVNLGGFEFNQLDVYTCNEIPELIPGQPCNYYSKFSGSLDVSGIGPGTHRIDVYATNADGLVGYAESYLTVVEPEPSALEVTDHPDNASVEVGEATSWSVTAGGGVPPYSYTWEAMGPQASTFLPVNNCCNTTGSSTRTLVLDPAVPQYDGARVRCRIEDSAGATVVSQPAWLWVGGPLQFVAHPQDVTVSVGQDATFSVDVFGGEPPYAYQWQGRPPGHSGFYDLHGKVDPTLTMESVGTAADGWAVHCRVTDSTGDTVYSNSALLSVDSP